MHKILGNSSYTHLRINAQALNLTTGPRGRQRENGVPG